MRLSRREFVGVAVAAAGSGLVGGRVFARARRGGTYFEWKKAGDHGHVALGEGGNALVVLGEEGALLIDCKNAPFGATLRREAGALGRLSAVVNTHHHGDHTGGNCAFTPDLLVYAHEKAKPRILGQLARYKDQVSSGMAAVSRSAKPDTERTLEEAKALVDRLESLAAAEFAPTRTVGDQEELEIAGRRVALHHFGAGHTDNDVVVHLPELNVLHTGDLLFHRMYPYWDSQGGVSGEGWIRSLRETLALCDDATIVIPGHGEITDKAGVQGGIDTLERVRDSAAAAIKAGKSKDEFVKSEIPELTNFGLTQAKPLVFGGWYDELSR